MRTLSLIRALALLGLLVWVSRTALATQYNFQSGQGYITYTVNYTTGYCPGGSWQYWSYSNLIYIDPNGGSNTLGGGGAYFFSPGGQYCPPNGRQPSNGLTFGGSSSGFVITWSPEAYANPQATVAFTGRINPTYQVVSVLYAPPGHSSFADYSQTTMVGTSASITSSFQESVSKSVTFGYTGGAIFGTDSYSNTAGSTLSQVQDSSASIDLSFNVTQGYRINGPSDDALGLYHPADEIDVWVNPVANLTLSGSGTSVAWTAFSWDGRDTYVHNIDIARITVYELQNLSWFENNAPGTWARVKKTNWNPSEGLTDDDFVAIQGHNPYSNANPAPDPTRYMGPVQGGSIPYEPATCPNCQPFTWYWSSNYSVTNTQGRSAQYSFSVALGITAKYSTFDGLFTTEQAASGTWMWANKWSSTQASKVTHAASVSVTGPAYGSGYNGPTAFNMYQDNIYGTYMFHAAQ